MKFIYFTFRFLFFTPLIYFFYFPFEYNLDYQNYYLDYINNNNSFDFLYEKSLSLMRDIFNLSFNKFLLVLMIFQIIALSIIYNNFLLSIIAYPILIATSQFFFGTQFRYSIACLFFILIFQYIKNKKTLFFSYIIPLLFHYGTFFILVLSLISNYIPSKILNIRRKKSIFFLVFFILILNILLFNINYLLSFTRFNSYIGSTQYLSNKSISSILFMGIFLFFLLNGYSKYNFYRLKISKLSIITLTFCLSTSSIAILSGRVLLVFMIFCPILIYNLFRYDKRNINTFSLFILYIIMSISLFMKNNYYFF